MITVTQQKFNKQYRAGAPEPTGQQLRKRTGRYSGPRNRDSSKRVKETLHITSMYLQARLGSVEPEEPQGTFKGPQSVKPYPACLQLIFQSRVREEGVLSLGGGCSGKINGFLPGLCSHLAVMVGHLFPHLQNTMTSGSILHGFERIK